MQAFYRTLPNVDRIALREHTFTRFGIKRSMTSEEQLSRDYSPNERKASETIA